MNKNTVIETNKDDNEIKMICMAKNMGISFHNGSIKLLKRIAEVFERHVIFREIVEDAGQLIIEGLDKIYEKKLAMFMSINVMKRKNVVLYYIMDDDDIIDESNRMVKVIFRESYNTFASDRTIEYLLDGYPIGLIAKICNTEHDRAHIMGECVRTFIELRDMGMYNIPKELYNVIEGNYPLVGHEKSPLNEAELNAIYRYLGSRKTIYVHILLNCLYEMTEHNIIMNNERLLEEDLKTICNSSWLYLFLIAANQNISRDKDNSDEYGYNDNMDMLDDYDDII